MHEKIDASIVLWVLDYLTNRPQFVKRCQNIISEVILANTGTHPRERFCHPFYSSCTRLVVDPLAPTV